MTLPEYDAVVSFPSQNIFSYDKPLFGLKKITVSPSKLESTSLVFVYGTDIFFAKVAPEKQFDVLTEDFNTAYFLLTLLGLFILCIYGSYYKKNKDMKKKIF